MTLKTFRIALRIEAHDFEVLSWRGDCMERCAVVSSNAALLAGAANRPTPSGAEH
jgi:hypothetical protein